MFRRLGFPFVDFAPSPSSFNVAAQKSFSLDVRIEDVHTAWRNEPYVHERTGKASVDIGSSIVST